MAFTDPVFQWLAYELAAIFAILAIWLIYRMSRKSRKIALETRSAVNAIKQSRDERRQQLSDTLQANYGFDGDTLAAELDALTARERELHKHAMSVFVGQDAKALASLNMAIQQHLDAGLAITPISSSFPDESAQQVQQLAAENAELTATISRLNQQFEQVEVAQASEQIEIEAAEASAIDDMSSNNDQQTTALANDEMLFEEDVESLLAGQEIEIIDVIDAENPDVDVVVDDVLNVPQVFNETEEQSLEDALTKDVEVESAEGQTPEQESLKSIEDPLTVASKRRMAEFANSDWQATVPDIYGKSTVMPAETIDAVDENIEKIEVVKTRRRLNDFLRPNWQPNTPDIYGKHFPTVESNTALQSEDNIPEQLEDITSALDAEDTLPSDNEATVAELPEVLPPDAADVSHRLSSFKETNEAETQIKDSETKSLSKQPISDASDDIEKASEDVITDTESDHQTARSADLEKQIDPLQDSLEAIGEQHVDTKDFVTGAEESPVNTTISEQEMETIALQQAEEAFDGEGDTDADFDIEVEQSLINTTISEQEMETIALQQAEEAFDGEGDADTDFETEADRLAAFISEPEALVEGADSRPSADQLLHQEEIATSEQQIEFLSPQDNDKVDIDSPPDALEKLRARLRQKTAALAVARTLPLDKAIDTELDQTEQRVLSDNAFEQSDVSEEKKPDETFPAEVVDSGVVDAAHSDLAFDALLSVDNTIEPLPAAQKSLLDTEQEAKSAINLDVSQPEIPLAQPDDISTFNEARELDEGIAVTAFDETDDFDEAFNPIDETPLSSDLEISEDVDRVIETSAEMEITAEVNSQEKDLTLEKIDSAAMPAVENETVNTDISLNPEVVADQIASDRLSAPEAVLTEVKEVDSVVKAMSEKELPVALEMGLEADVTLEQSGSPAMPYVDTETVNVAASVTLEEVAVPLASEVVLTDVSNESVEEVEDFVAALAREQTLAAQEKARTESEIAGFEKQSPQPALPEEQDISGFLSELDQLRESQKLASQTENQAHLNAAANYPLPEQTALDELMDEVRTLQPHNKLKPVSDKEQQTALRSILSKIPSFAESKSRQS